MNAFADHGTILISHRFKLADAMSAYETFGNAERERASKYILTND